MAESKICKYCGKTFYRRNTWSDKTWKGAYHCNYRCKQKLDTEEKPQPFNFTTMKLSNKPYPLM